MKKAHMLFYIFLAGALVAGCGTAAPPPATPFAESMKGYELYSWQAGGQWNFSILVGTNREKTLEEIKSAGVTLTGVEELVAALKRMPAGQYITWTSRETLSFPPAEIIEQVEKLCEEQGLILNKAV